MKATKTQAKNCYDNYFGVLRCLNGGTREENERSSGRCREELRKYVEEAAELLKTPSKLLREDAWLMRALAEDIPNNFAAFNRNYPPTPEVIGKHRDGTTCYHADRCELVEINVSHAVVNRMKETLIESAAQAVEEIGEDELERFSTAQEENR